MKRRNEKFKNPIILFAAGFFAGLFIKFIPVFIVFMLLLLVAGGIYRCISN